MERFKALEKEMKMKAYSKEGLIAQSQLAPAEKHKREIIDWIGTTTEELSRQIEQTEAEVEQLGTGGGKKTKKAQGDRLNELEELNERRQWHIGRMEVVQRMLENGQLEPEQVEAIQEDVNYFVEANTVSAIEFGNLSKMLIDMCRRKTLTTTRASTTSSTCKMRRTTTPISFTTTSCPTSTLLLSQTPTLRHPLSSYLLPRRL